MFIHVMLLHRFPSSSFAFELLSPLVVFDESNAVIDIGVNHEFGLNRGKPLTTASSAPTCVSRLVSPLLTSVRA